MHKILLDINEKSEINIFLNFLNNKEYPQHRNIIFSFLPELKTVIDVEPKSESDVVKKFIEDLRKGNKENIDTAVNFVKHEVEAKGEKALDILAGLMNYEWQSENQGYILVPTIFPLSPFKDNIFYFSIYKCLKGVTAFPRVLAVSIHEISHIMLYDILKDINEELSHELLYFIKELIAPIIVYQDDFCDIFKKEIVGNYNVLEIYFKMDDKTITAFDYFLKLFEKNRAEGNDFRLFVGQMIHVCKEIESDIIKKRQFDNNHGIQIMKDPALLKEFREPILLH
ncbi:MAG: hypothetical protein WCV79_01255 [Candidatus Paceibacterota bacterium]|jgi:hypothetical protein